MFLRTEGCLLSSWWHHKVSTPPIYEVQGKSTYQPMNSRKPKLPKTSIHQFTIPTTHSLSTQKLINPPTHQLKNLKSLFLFYNDTLFSTPFQRKSGLKSRKNTTISCFSLLPRCLFLRKNLYFARFCLSRMVANSSFFRLNYPFLDPKIPLFNHYFALFSHVFHDSKRFCLYHCRAFLCVLPCIQHHFTLRLAPKCAAFSTKTHCIQHQNTLRLAPKYTAFSTKMHCILPQKAPKRVLMAMSLNKYSL